MDKQSGILLRQISAWFTEGLDTAPLLDANQLISELVEPVAIGKNMQILVGRRAFGGACLRCCSGARSVLRARQQSGRAVSK
jgi:hypothetical protein